jgi:hypothetical protein
MVLTLALKKVMCHEIRDYVRLVDVASLVERGMRESSAAYELKKRSMLHTS